MIVTSLEKRCNKGLFETRYIGTRDQQADLLTKALGRSPHDFLLSKLGVLNIFSTSSLRGNIGEIVCLLVSELIINYNYQT